MDTDIKAKVKVNKDSATPTVDAAIADTVLMVPPKYFCYNSEAAETNWYWAQQQQNQNIQNLAMQEFSNMVKELQEHGVNVIQLEPLENTPDSVFPNNWFSCSADGLVRGQLQTKITLYPMLTENRRRERQPEQLVQALEEWLLEQKSWGGESEYKFQICQASLDKALKYENENLALEGTGSIVFDHQWKGQQNQNGPRAFIASNSTRSSWAVANDYFKNYEEEQLCFFDAVDESGKWIYHTNVILSIGDGFAVLCSESIRDLKQREDVVERLSRWNSREIIHITLCQVKKMCGNILQLRGSKRNCSSDKRDNKETDPSININQKLIVMSKTCLQKDEGGFTEDQQKTLAKYGKLVPVDIETIERIGGGSARCMMAEIFYWVDVVR